MVLGEHGTSERERQADDDSLPPGALCHGLGLPWPDHVPARAGAGHHGADRRALSLADAHSAQPPWDRLRAGALGAGRRRSRSAPTASTASRTARSLARIHSRRSVPTRRITSAAQTASSTAPTSSSTAPTGPRPTRWRPSRSSSAPTAAWAASSPFRSRLPRPSGRCRPSRSSAQKRCTSLMRRWLADLGHEEFKNLGTRREPRKAVEA